jgi:hypothetical protein
LELLLCEWICMNLLSRKQRSLSIFLIVNARAMAAQTEFVLLRWDVEVRLPCMFWAEVIIFLCLSKQHLRVYYALISADYYCLAGLSVCLGLSEHSQWYFVFGFCLGYWKMLSRFDEWFGLFHSDNFRPWLWFWESFLGLNVIAEIRFRIGSIGFRLAIITRTCRLQAKRSLLWIRLDCLNCM